MLLLLTLLCHWHLKGIGGNAPAIFQSEGFCQKIRFVAYGHFQIAAVQFQTVFGPHFVNALFSLSCSPGQVQATCKTPLPGLFHFSGTRLSVSDFCIGSFVTDGMLPCMVDKRLN